MGRGFGWSHRHDVGITGCFQEGQSEGQNIKAENEEIEVGREAGGEAEKGADRVECKADHDGCLVGILPDKECRRESHGEVTAVKSRLNER